MVELFSKGRAWRDFRDLEGELVESLDYVPLRSVHNNVWSPKFGKLLDETGSAVDSFFKVAIKEGSKFPEYQEADPDKLDIIDYAKIANPVYRLDGAKVDVTDGISEYGVLVPFEAFVKKESPEWWRAYNKYKHYRYSFIDYASLRNVVEALAGLFLLNVLHKENQQYLVEKSVIQGPAGFGSKMISVNLTRSNFGAPIPGYLAKSELFVHAFRVDRNRFTSCVFRENP